MAIESRLFKTYNKSIKKELFKELKLSSVMQIPKIEKIVINIGLGPKALDKKNMNDAMEELAKICGQKPIVTVAKKSNASFKIRQNMPIGVKVTLRNNLMYNFLDKLISVALPRIRDFRGIKSTSLDEKGNLTMGIPEFIVFPEIELDKVSQMKGMDISIITNCDKKEESLLLFRKIGIPFKK